LYVVVCFDCTTCVHASARGACPHRPWHTGSLQWQIHTRATYADTDTEPADAKCTEQAGAQADAHNMQVDTDTAQTAVADAYAHST